MGFSKTLRTGVAAAILSVCAVAPAAHAVEVGASVSVASAYLWRGFELGSGTPAISGDVTISESGFYGTVWVSSGDTSAGTEYDLIVGYGGEVGDFSYDINLTNYIYPTGDFQDTDGDIGDFAEIIVSLGYGPVSASYYNNIAGDTGGYAFNEDYQYATLSASFGAFSATLGKHFEDAPVADSVTGDSMHLDLSYAYNDYVTLTASRIIDSDSGYDKPKTTFVIGLSMPIDFNFND